MNREINNFVIDAWIGKLLGTNDPFGLGDKIHSVLIQFCKNKEKRRKERRQVQYENQVKTCQSLGSIQ